MKQFYLFVLAMSLVKPLRAQDTLKENLSPPRKYLSEVTRKAKSTAQFMDQKIDKAIVRWCKYEETLRKRISAINPNIAGKLFADHTDNLKQFRQILQKKIQDAAISRIEDNPGELILNFLNNKLTSGDEAKKLASITSLYKQTQEKLLDGERLKEWMRSRREELQSQLNGYICFNKDLKRLNKEASTMDRRFGNVKKCSMIQARRS